MAEIWKVMLERSDNCGFGFSLLGTVGPPHVIYDIIENSPAADCGAVEAGDVILKVNGTDVHRYTTKEVLKCLRLSEDVVTLELKRDKKLKARIKKQISQAQTPHHTNDRFGSSSGYSNAKSTFIIANCAHTSNRLEVGPQTHAIVTDAEVVNSRNLPSTRYKPPYHISEVRPGSTSSENSRPSDTSSKTVGEEADRLSPTTATSPTFRPSKIPQAMKCPQKPQTSPQNKRSRPSQIPTKTSPPGAGNGSFGNITAGLQHSSSYSGPYIRQEPNSTQREQECDSEPFSAPPQRSKTPRFEAYMMTGDLILNLSRTPQTSNILTSQMKKVDSLRDSNNCIEDKICSRTNGGLAPRASGESSPTSPSTTDSPPTASNIDSNNMKENRENPVLEHERTDYTYNRKDSVTNDTLHLCDEIDRDDDALPDGIAWNESYGDCQRGLTQGKVQNAERVQSYTKRNKLSQEFHKQENPNFQYYNDDEDTTHYGITNLETYNSDEIVSGSHKSEAGGYEGVEEYKCTSPVPVLAKQKLRNPKQTPEPLLDRNDDVARSPKSSSNCFVPSSSPTCKSECVRGTRETSISTPSSPVLLPAAHRDNEIFNSVPTSPGYSSIGLSYTIAQDASLLSDVIRRNHNGYDARKCDVSSFRSSKSEDHLQQIQREGSVAVIPTDLCEDINSSLNTLLDARHDSDDSQVSNQDRIVWTYNAPLQPNANYSLSQHNHSSSNSNTTSMSPFSHNSAESPASLTSVSSSVMSSSGSRCGQASTYAQSQHQQENATKAVQDPPTQLSTGVLQFPSKGDCAFTCSGLMFSSCEQSVSEAISNISSPDYQDDGNLISSRDILGGMLLSDPSDSDSTILVSEGATKQLRKQLKRQTEHKVVIQVRGCDSNSVPTLKDTVDSCCASRADNTNSAIQGESSHPVLDDCSDVESLHSYHYSPKAVDMPSAIRLAKRLYSLDGFKKSDVSRHLSKNNDFSRAVADEYLKYFNFESKTLEQSLREFLQKFSLSGETQERERVLVHFSKRFLDCNPGAFNSQDAVHTLTCGIMLLNTDLHGQNISRKMSCAEFIDNLAELNDGENFPKEVLKHLYQAIKANPLEWAQDVDEGGTRKHPEIGASAVATACLGQNPFLDLPELANSVEYKKGYVMRKCCYDSNYKKTPFGKRSWKMFYCTLRDLVLYLHKDEHGFRKSQISDNLHNAIRIHHALATIATDYTKKQHVFRLETADQAEYLFQTSDSKELNSWVDTINFVCAAYSAPQLEGAVGSQKRFQRPLLPCAQTRFLIKEQLENHVRHATQLERDLIEHKACPTPSKGLPMQNYKEKEAYLLFELRRYKAYVLTLKNKLIIDEQLEQSEMQVINTDLDEPNTTLHIDLPAYATHQD